MSNLPGHYVCPECGLNHLDTLPGVNVLQEQLDLAESRSARAPVELSDDLDTRAAQLAPVSLLPYCKRLAAFHRRHAFEVFSSPAGASVCPDVGRPKVMGPAILIVAGILVIAILIFGGPAGVPMFGIGIGVVVVLVVCGVIGAAFAVGKGARPQLFYDRARNVFVSPQATVQLGDPENAFWYFIEGEQCRWPHTVYQLVLVSRSRGGAWSARAIWTGIGMSTAAEKLAPFLRAPVYTAQLSWRPAKTPTIALKDPPESLVYHVLCIPREIAETQGVKLDRIWGKCLKCKYPLEGVASPAACPECGQAFR